MAEHKVLITTSGIGSRLGKLTDFTNKSLVRIGDIPAISHIIEYYPIQTRFVITLGHYGNLVKQFLEITYPNRNFEFVEVDNFKGKGSSLGYSILQAKSNLQCPFIFHASDTIIENLEFNFESNFCIGAKKNETSQYTTLMVTNGYIKKINQKGELNFDYPYAGICGIKDYNIFWSKLENLYNENPEKTNLFEGDVINKMLNECKFKFIETHDWYDMGNTTELEKTRNHFGSSIEVLDKQNESIYFFKDFVIKFFSDKKINYDRVTRAKLLNKLVPNVVASTDNFYRYEKADGRLFSKSVNSDSFKTFLQWSKDNLWKEKTLDSIHQLCFDFYIKKTNKRIESYLNNKKDQPEIINGILIPPIEELLAKIDVEWLCAGVPSNFHGDFILDNILETNNGFCLLDWRQNFGNSLEIGDLYYDLAKLNHNLTVNHSIVDSGLFDHSNNNCHILCSSTLIECQKILHQFIREEGYDLTKVKLLTSIIWLNMAPLHEYPFNNFLFRFGKYNLYKILSNERH